MDGLDAIRNEVHRQSYTCDVRRVTGNGPYDDDTRSVVGTVEVAVSAPSASAQVVQEGSIEETSLVGHIVPETDTDGTLVESVHITDHLDVQNHPQKYVVRTKVGIPDAIDPDLWELALDRANDTE